MGDQYGVIGGMLVGLGVIARFIWKWEKTFTDSAIEELQRLRQENRELREKLRRYEDRN